MGLIGGSIGLRARALGWNVAGYDLDPAVMAAARARGALSSVAPSLLALAAGADVLVLAGPVDATVAQIGELKRSGAAGRTTLVLDVGSVKVPAANAGARLANFVPTHPIAGSEKSGPGSASADLFVERTWAYDPALHPQAAPRARRFIAAMGARPFAIGCAEHDRLVALSSHLPQLLSVALGAHVRAALEGPAARELSGSGMRSMLRLAASSFPMWKPVLLENAVPLAQEVRALAAILTGAADALESGAAEKLRDLFGAAAASVAAMQANARAPGDVTRVEIETDER